MCMCLFICSAVCLEIRFNIGRHHLTWKSHYPDLWSETAFVSGSWPQDSSELTEKKEEVCDADTFMCNEKVT